MRRKLVLVLGLALLLALAPQVALAAPVTQEDSPGESNLSFLFAGFAVVWAGLFAYVFYLHRRGQDLRREVESLRRELAEREERTG